MDDKAETLKVPNSAFLHLEDYVTGLVHDSDRVLYDLDRIGANKYKVIEIYADVPERPEPGLFMAAVLRWLDIANHYKRPVRVYSYVYNEASERMLYNLISPHNELYITIIPGYLKKKGKKNA